MCKYCEKNDNGLFKPLARNSLGGASLVEIGVSENTGEPVMRVNYDESEPLQLGIHFCPMCGKRLSPWYEQLPIEDMTFHPEDVGTYSVPLDDGTILAIPNPCSNYTLFCSQIKKIATGVYDELNDRTWSITRVWRLLNQQVKGINVIYDSKKEVLSIGKWSEIGDARYYIATVDYLFLPTSVKPGVVCFTTPVAWEDVTNENYKYLKFVLEEIVNSHVTLKAREENSNENDRKGTNP